MKEPRRHATRKAGHLQSQAITPGSQETQEDDVRQTYGLSSAYWFARLLAVLLATTLSAASNRSVLAERSGSAPLSSARTKTGPVMLRAFDSVAQAARSSVVLFEADGEKLALGTIIDASGLALSKASELAGRKLSAQLADGRLAAAKVLATDEGSDLALVQVQAKGLQPIQWAASPVALGQWAITPGPGPVPEALGVISATPRRIRAKRALIGVLPDFSSNAAVVKEVVPGLGAEQAGMQPGDVILSVNGSNVSSGEDLVNALRNYLAGQRVPLRIRRGETELDLSVLMMAARPGRFGKMLERQERMNRLGADVSERAEGFSAAVQHDTMLQPWQCGGPLVDLDGRAIGVNIARAGRIASYALPAQLVSRVATDLRRRADNLVRQKPSPIQ